MKQARAADPAIEGSARKTVAKKTTSKKAAPAQTRTQAPAVAQAPAHAQAESSGEARAQAIRQTAYAYYEARGFIAGHELEDWLKAEADVDGKTAGAEPAPAAAVTH
jgi:hypothetical protein